jgi:hypothetical protein
MFPIKKVSPGLSAAQKLAGVAFASTWTGVERDSCFRGSDPGAYNRDNEA